MKAFLHLVMWMALTLSGVVERPQYGVMFIPDKTLLTEDANWDLTIAYPLIPPDEVTMPDILCTSLISDWGVNDRYRGINPAESRGTRLTAEKMCQDFEILIEEYRDMGNMVKEKIKSTGETIKELLHPSLRVRDSTARAAALLHIVGKISKYLFGTATAEDTEKLAGQVAQIVKFLNKSSDLSRHYQQGMNSLVKITNERIDNANKAIRANHERLNQSFTALSILASRVRDERYGVSQLWDEFSLFMSVTLASLRNSGLNVRYLEEYVLHSEAVMTGVQYLLTGRLPVQLVPPKLLREQLKIIRGMVEANYPMFFIKEDNIADLYRQSNTIYTYVNDMLIMRLKIPLTTTEGISTLYMPRRKYDRDPTGIPPGSRLKPLSHRDPGKMPGSQ